MIVIKTTGRAAVIELRFRGSLTDVNIWASPGEIFLVQKFNIFCHSLPTRVGSNITAMPLTVQTSTNAIIFMPSSKVHQHHCRMENGFMCLLKYFIYSSYSNNKQLSRKIKCNDSYYAWRLSDKREMKHDSPNAHNYKSTLNTKNMGLQDYENRINTTRTFRANCRDCNESYLSQFHAHSLVLIF